MLLPVEQYRRVLGMMPILCVDCLVVNTSGEYLLVKRKNEPLKGEYWVPGGRVHKNERLTDAVRRKMREEIGVGVEIVKCCGFFEEFFDKSAENAENGVHAVSFLYLVKPCGDRIKLDDQSSEWGWFSDPPARLLGYPTIQIETE